MSTGDMLVTATDGLPTYDLDFRFDAPDDPEEVTVFDGEGDDHTTAWVSASIEDSVRLDEIA
jgi:hypothetical protein